MELLVIKNGTDYIRIKDGTFSAVGLEKASVFPLDRLAYVNDQLADVRAGEFPQAAIHLLTITETPL